MFDVTPDEIAQLNDVDLRELVGRLSEAELTSRGLSPVAVTWGGNQTAADGGLDVRVALPTGSVVNGFIPRRSTGFQVKTPDMARSAILSEMRPTGVIRPVIQELAHEAGSYVIVSSRGSTADRALRDRQEALREALRDVANADQLHTDFYDRTRLATWVRCHPGLITWVKEKVGRALVGWRAYGPWTGGAEGLDAEYLLDDKLRLHLGKHRDAPAQSVAEAIDEVRDELARPGKIVRLVGLSGVGKTRFVQALFDARIGSRALPPSLAVYTNLSDNPDPQPTGLASDLIANRTRAVLIVDNCPPDLHRTLAGLCATSGSTVSVLTVEYDVRDDQPEGTQVVTLDTSSPELIGLLVARRYPYLSEVDARTIAEASGGNARIAIALAETIERSETIAGLSDEELFQRLFRQRHDPDNALLVAGQVCSLVYSYQGEALFGDGAELPRLALLAGQTAAEIYRHVGELLRRDLVQRRGVWRAVLPHAIANRLAARALEDIPFNLIDEQLVAGGTDRLARSFTRRLSFLHEHPSAVGIVRRWLAPGGLLGDVVALNDLGRAMFENVAPVSPEDVLTALERAVEGDRDAAAVALHRHRRLLRSLAYDPPLFERSVSLLSRAATHGAVDDEARAASDVFASLFTIYLSGTHATIEQRVGVIERLLSSDEPRSRSLGLAALNKLLKKTHFSSSYRFEFGARSRDYGYRPQSYEEMSRWYEAALSLIERLAFSDRGLKPELTNVLAKNFRSLWSLADLRDQVESLSFRFAEGEFWYELWTACRQTLHFDRERMTPEEASRLFNLEAGLSPSNLRDRVHAVVLGDRSGGAGSEVYSPDADIIGEIERLNGIAREFGAMAARDEALLSDLLPNLLRGGNRTWAFGRGLASVSLDCQATWMRLVAGLDQLSLEQRDVQVLRGFVAELWEQDRDLAQELLDVALREQCLLPFLPLLQAAVGVDQRGVERLRRAMSTGQVPVTMYRSLAFGQATDALAGSSLRDLLLPIADQPDGFDVALDILCIRLRSNSSERQFHEPALLEVGRDLLSRVSFGRGNQRADYNLAEVVKACLAEPGAGPVAAAVAQRLRQAVATFETYAFDNDDLLEALLEVQPEAVLDALFPDGERDNVSVFDHLSDHRANPVDVISTERLITWCEQDRDTRFPLAASLVTFECRPNESGPPAWSDHARALLARAPNPRRVLSEFIERFRPMSWSGSRAALMEANAQLLEALEPPELPADCISLVVEARAQLALEIASMRQWETEHDQDRNERFE